MHISAALIASAAAAAVVVVVVGLGTGSAAATPTPLASTHDSTITDDGWELKLDATELVANPMHNLAQ